MPPEYAPSLLVVSRYSRRCRARRLRSRRSANQRSLSSSPIVHGSLRRCSHSTMSHFHIPGKWRRVTFMFLLICFVLPAPPVLPFEDVSFSYSEEGYSFISFCVAPIHIRHSPILPRLYISYTIHHPLVMCVVMVMCVLMSQSEQAGLSLRGSQPRYRLRLPRCARGPQRLR